MGRLVQQTEALAEVSSTSTVATTIASLTAALTSGKTYALFWSFQATSSATTIVSRGRLMDSTGGVELSRYRVLPADTTDYVWQGGVAYYTAATTANRTFIIDFSNASGTGTTYIKNARLVILELDPLDKFAGDVSFASTTDTNYTSALDLTFTPPTSGDYLFFACGTSAANRIGVKLLTPGGTSVNEEAAVLQVTTPYGGWAAQWRETLAASSQTASIQYKSATGETEQLGFRYILALRVDRLQNVQTTQDDADDGGTDNTYVDSETLAATGLTADTRDTIVIAAATVSDGSTTESSYVEILEGSTTLMEGIHEGTNASNKDRSGMLAYKVADTASSITYKVRRKSETSATTTTIKYASIFIFGVLKDNTQSLAATSTVSASIAKTAHKYLTDAAVATTASMQRTISKFLVGTSTVTGTVQKVVSLTMAATSTVSAAVLKMYAVTLAATSAASASITRTTHKFLSATSTTTATLSRLVAFGVTLTATSTVTATLATIRLFTMAMTATSAVTASMTRTVSITMTATISAFAKPIQWVASMYAAIRGDKPNWNQCARCLKSVRPNKLLQQMEYRGPRLVWTGLYVCAACEDQPQPQNNIAPRHIGGDPRPVPNARPRRD